MDINKNLKLIKYILFSLLFLLLAGLCIKKMADHDTWFHLKTGEYILENKKLPDKDPYSYTVPENKYIDSHWLFQIFLYITCKLGKINGIIIFKTVFIFLTYILLILSVYKKENFPFSIFIVFLSFFTSFDRFSVRPEIWTFFFIALYIYLLEKHSEKKIIYTLPLFQLIWANSHGLHLSGPFILWTYTIFSKNANKRYTIISLLTTIASFISPYGIEGAKYPFLLFTELSTRKTVAELHSPFSEIFKSWPTLKFYKLLIFLSILTFILNYKKIRTEHLILSLTFFYLSLRAIRNLPVFSFIAVITCIYNFNLALEDKKKTYKFKKITILNNALTLFLLFVLPFSIYFVISNKLYAKYKIAMQTGFGIYPATFPQEAVDFIINNNITGNILNDNPCGGYLIWRFYPHRKVFIDGRWEVYGEEFMKKYWENYGNINLSNSLLNRYNVDYILLTHSSVEAKKITPNLLKSPQWVPVYIDDIAIVFVKNSSTFKDIIEKYRINFENVSYTSSIEKYRPSYIWIDTLISKGIILCMAEKYRAGYFEFKKVLKIDPENQAAKQNIQNIKILVKDPAFWNSIEN